MLQHLIDSFFKFGAQVVMQIKDTQLHRKAFQVRKKHSFLYSLIHLEEMIL